MGDGGDGFGDVPETKRREPAKNRGGRKPGTSPNGRGGGKNEGETSLKAEVSPNVLRFKG
jgi:hypothetical protein